MTEKIEITMDSEEMKERNQGVSMFKENDLAVLWEESTLKGLHKNLEEVIETEKRLVWPEIYSFLLADIAMSLRKMADSFSPNGLDVDIVDLVSICLRYDDTKSSKKGGRGNGS